METALIALLSSIVTTIVTQLCIRFNFTDSLREDYKKRYFEKQFDAYLEFWCLLKPLSEHSKVSIIERIEGDCYLNKENTVAFIYSINEFFFCKHGMFLTRDLRKLLFSFRDVLYGQLRQTSKEQKTVKLTSKHFQLIKINCTKLMAAARNDIGLLNIKFDLKNLTIEHENSELT